MTPGRDLHLLLIVYATASEPRVNSEHSFTLHVACLYD